MAIDLSSSGGNQSQTTTATSVGRNSDPTPPVAIADIERRLSTAKTLDLFTMNPRVRDQFSFQVECES